MVCFAPDHLLIDILFISVASFLGVFLRILFALAAKANSISAPSFLLANIIGCFFMSQTIGVSRSIPARVVPWITTGLCGALTSFSAWQQFSASILVVGGDPFAWILALLIGFAVWTGSYDCGRHASRLGPKLYAAVIVAIAIAAAVSAVVLRFSDKQLISVALGPIGGVIRYLVSSWVNKGFNGTCTNWFPFGTFACNIAGCILVGVVLSLTCDLDHPAIVGIAGSLTTVSTFVSEIDQMATWNKYVYALSSTVVAQVALISLLVSFR